MSQHGDLTEDCCFLGLFSLPFAALDTEDLAIFWDDFETLSGSQLAVLVATSSCQKEST